MTTAAARAAKLLNIPAAKACTGSNEMNVGDGRGLPNSGGFFARCSGCDQIKKANPKAGLITVHAA